MVECGGSTRAPSSTRRRLCRYGVPCLILIMLVSLILVLVLPIGSRSDHHRYDIPELYTMPSKQVASWGAKLIRELRAEIETIATNSQPATFENTIVPFDAIFFKYRTACLSCQAHSIGASDAERRKLLNLLDYPALFRNAKLYARVRSVFETLPEGNEDHRATKACEAMLRDNGSSLNATLADTFDELHVQTRIDWILYQNPPHDFSFVQRLIFNQCEKTRLVSPYHDFASYQIARACAGSTEQVESMLAVLAQFYSNIGLGRFQPDLRNGSHENDTDWGQYVDDVMVGLAMLHDARWKLEDVLWKGIFFAAKKLHGLDVVERFDIPKIHSDVRVFELLEDDGRQLGLIFMDLKERTNKSSGINASLVLMERSRHSNLNHSAVTIFMSLPADSDRINFYEVWTLFHEFGHSLHMLFSNPTYAMLSASRAPLDWLEFPSQLNEMWAHDPQVLRNIDPGLTEDQIEQIRNEFAFADALKKFHDLLTGIAKYHWNHVAQPPADIASFVRELQAKYGLEFISDPETFLSPMAFKMFSVPLQYGYSFSWRIAKSVQDWVKANGGLCRKTGDQIRQEALSKGWSVTYQDMIKSVQIRAQNVTLHDDLNQHGALVDPQTIPEE